MSSCIPALDSVHATGAPDAESLNPVAHVGLNILTNYTNQVAQAAAA